MHKNSYWLLLFALIYGGGIACFIYASYPTVAPAGSQEMYKIMGSFLGFCTFPLVLYVFFLEIYSHIKAKKAQIDNISKTNYVISVIGLISGVIVASYAYNTSLQGDVAVYYMNNPDSFLKLIFSWFGLGLLPFAIIMFVMDTFLHFKAKEDPSK